MQKSTTTFQHFVWHFFLAADTADADEDMATHAPTDDQ